MPICLWAGTPLAHAASWADAVAFGSSGDEVITFDGTAYFWNALSQGSYEYAITEPEFKLKLLGNSLVDVRFFQDPNHFVTVTTASGEEGIDQEIIVQGWMKSITRLRSAESKLGKFSKTAARASDGDLWFEPEKQSALLYDFDRDELANVPLAASDEDIVKICTDPRLIMLRNGKRLELWQATGSAVQEVAVPDEIVASLVNDQPVDLICGQQTVAIAEGNNIVLWKLGGGGAPLSIDLVAPIKHLRTLDADNLLAIDSGGTAYLMNSRGEKKASGATDLFNSIDESSSLREACFSEGRGALLFGRSDGGTDYLIQFSVTGANLSFSVHPNLNEPFSTVNRRCTLVAYHAFRTREAGVFDLKNNTRMLDFRLPESESWGIDYLEGKNGIVALSNVGLYFLRFDDDLDRTVDKARKSIVACLTPEEREALSLAPEPPHWCITGPGHETDTDPAHWEPKPPYDTDAWKEWLLAARGARQTGDDPPPVPRPQEAEAGVEVH